MKIHINFSSVRKLWRHKMHVLVENMCVFFPPKHVFCVAVWRFGVATNLG